MNRDMVREVIRDVFGRDTEMNDLGGWVSIRCPLAPWTHETGGDSSPSAGVSVADDSTSIFNCLAGSTLVRTRAGYSPISQLAGTSPVLQMPDGTWLSAPIHSYGKQELLAVTLSRNSRKQTILATAGHRWFQKCGPSAYREVTTTQLRPGVALQQVREGGSKSYESLHWVVESVVPTGRTEEVYCAEVPGYHAFVLYGGVVTGNCFTCGNTAPFHVMLGKYSEFTGEDLGDLIEELEEGEFLGPRQLTGLDQVYQSNITEVLMPINESIYMDLYDSAAGHPYLKQRGISKATARKLELLYDPKDSEGDPRILFPVRGVDGLLYGFSGRATKPTARLKVRDYHGLAKSHLVLGAHLVGPGDDVEVVEGLIDYAAMHEMGYCGCAVMHSTMTEHQAAIIAGLGAPAYLFYDNDKAGRKGVITAGNQLCQHVTTFKVRWPDVWIEDNSEEGGHWINDPGELIAEEVAQMKRTAQLWEKPYWLRTKRRN